MAWPEGHAPGRADEGSPLARSLHSLLLSRTLPWRSAPGWTVAFSGGLDSTVLLHLLVVLSRQGDVPPLSALHVHHGLQSAAEAWPAHCQAVCDRLGVPLMHASVVVEEGASLENAARRARYGVFEQAVEGGQVLMLAQHRDDQAETLLFRLMRGAGVRGLAGMPVSRALGDGHLLRPLLDVARQDLEAYAREQGLDWVEDPSNQDTRLDRNYLRQIVLPALVSRWPRALGGMARSAAHLAEGEALLGELAAIDLAAARDTEVFPWLGLPTLFLDPLLALSEPRQRNALRHWLAPFTAMPDSDHWAGWVALRDAAPDAEPVWRLAGGELRRAGGRLWWLGNAWLDAVPTAQPWPNPEHPLALDGNGVVWIEGRGPEGPLQVRYRQGGEAMQLDGRGRRDLKRLLNERGFPAFARGRLPLLYRGDELLAVPNLQGLDGPREGGWTLSWTPPTNDQGLS